MFETLHALPADPILGLNQKFHEDNTVGKINLSVGVYQDSAGQTPIFTAVKKAEQQLIHTQGSKAYIAQQGAPKFVSGINTLLFGPALLEQLADTVTTIMTPGGCGALRMGAELLVQSKNQATIWVSDPTWGNHYPLLESAGLNIQRYAYYDTEAHCIDFQKMLDALSLIPAGDVVLLHGCCHNPTGADLSMAQWDQVIDVLLERQLVPFIDTAYQGFGESLDNDAYGVRRAAEKLPEVLIASSCSKNFGLYRERTGAITVITQSKEHTAAAKSHILSSARKCYSMSPYHGGGIVGLLLADNALTDEWMIELTAVKDRMNVLRTQLADGLNNAQSKQDFSFVADSKGMFCYLGISREDVLYLRSEYGIYLLESTRMNIAGLSESNLPKIIDCVAKTIQR